MQQGRLLDRLSDILEEISADTNTAIDSLLELPVGQVYEGLKKKAEYEDVFLKAASPTVSRSGMVVQAGGPAKARVASKAAEAEVSPDDIPPVDVRTEEARNRYDKAVAEVIRKSAAPISANDARAKVHGTGPQFRKAVGRLIEQGLVGYEGRARAMRYFWDN